MHFVGAKSDCGQWAFKGFHYEAGEIVTTPMMVMYGLSMATNGYDGQYSTSIYKEQRRNCGALLVIRMPDNSLFIHDGGDIQQWSDDACDEFLAFCRELTGTTGTNEKMVINTWFLSHAHSDHFLGFPRFINKYHDHFEMKNIMYTIENAYKADGEGWPEYFELRNLIIAKKDFDALTEGAQTSGIVFIDNTLDAENNISYNVSDYTNYGPNNELYLAPGQSIAFKLEVSDPTGTAGDACDVAGIHLAMKSVGNTAKVKYYDAGSATAQATPVTEIATATDLYYDITTLNGKTVVIANTGESNDAILSITNIKVTYTAAHTDSLDKSFCGINKAIAKTALLSLRAMPTVEPEEPDAPVEPEVPVEPEEPEVFEPEKFNVRLSDSSVKVGSKVTVTVTTGADVDYITVNGTKVTKYTGSWFSSNRTWLARVEAEEVGQMDVAVVCYNSDDLASESVVETITVTQQYTSLTNVVKDLISGIFGRLWGRK